MCRECAGDASLAAACSEARSAALRRAYLFEDLAPELFAELFAQTREAEIDADQWLCFHGDRARSFFLVLAGEVALLRSSADGDEVIVTIVGPGELFGEDLAIVDDAVHPLSARTLGPCRIAEIDRQMLRSLLEREPRLVAKLVQTLHRRNALLLDEIERVSLQSASERLLGFLRREAAGPAPLRIPKRVLASRLSIRPETLSRILARLKEGHRLREVDGCLLPLDGSEEDDACVVCPARHWGCPGPESTRLADHLPAAVQTYRQEHDRTTRR